MPTNGSPGQKQPIPFPPKGNTPSKNTASGTPRGSPGSPRRRRRYVSHSTQRPNIIMQWAFLIITTVLTILLMLFLLALYYNNKSPYVLIPSSIGVFSFIGYMWRRMVLYLFPKNPEEIRLEETRIRHPYRIRRNNRQKP